MDQIKNISFSSITSIQAPEELRQIKTISHFLQATNNHATSICLQQIEKFPYSLAPKKRKKIIEQESLNEELFSNKKEKDEALSLIFTKAHVERQLIKKIIDAGSNALGLTEIEQIVLLASCDLGDQYDIFYWQWLHDISVRDVHELPEKLTNPYLYHIFNKKEDGTFQTLTYAQAFPEPIQKIAAITEKMTTDLRRLTPEDKQNQEERDALIQYYQLLTNALQSENPDELEQLFTDVDKAWFLIKGRMQPIHMMETYADPLHKRVTPEYILAFQDDQYKNLNQQLQKTKENIASYLQTHFGDRKTLEESLHPLQKSLAGVYTLFTSGKARVSKFVGKNVPNRPEVRLHDGVKIFINIAGIKKAHTTMIPTIAKVFGRKQTSKIFSNIIILSQMKAGFLTGGHEVAHNAFVNAKTRIKLAKQLQLLEEQKADLTAILAAEKTLAESDKKILLRLILIWNIVRLQKKNITASKPYYYLALLCTQTMVETGIIQQKTEDIFIYDEAPRKMSAFFLKLCEIYEVLIEVYETMDSQKAEKFVNTYNDDTKMPIVANIQKRLNLF